MLRQRQQQQHQQQLMSGMGVSNPGMVTFQGAGGNPPQMRPGIPNGMYAAGGPGGMPGGGNMTAFGAGNPQLRGFHPQMQHQLHQQQQQQQQIAAAQQFTMASHGAAAQGTAQTSGLSMPQQGPQIQMNSIQAQQQAALMHAQRQAAVNAAAQQQYVQLVSSDFDDIPPNANLG